MHIFCGNCGKHLEVSLEEVTNLRGHLVCPQCLENIEVPGDYGIDGPSWEETGTEPAPEVPEPQAEPPALSPSAATPQPSSPPPVPPAAPPPASGPVYRACTRCGAYLREGISYCPRCGQDLKSMPPPYRRNRGATPPQYQPRRPGNNSSQSRFSSSQPMAQKGKKKTSAKRSDHGKFSIYSIGGCITFTVIVVALFFIAYVMLGVHWEG